MTRAILAAFTLGATIGALAGLAHARPVWALAVASVAGGAHVLIVTKGTGS